MHRQLLLLLIASLAVSLMLAAPTYGKHVTASVAVPGNYSFLQKFCFGTSGKGNLTYTFKNILNAPTTGSTYPRLIMFNDKQEQWGRVFPFDHPPIHPDKPLTCEELVSYSYAFGSLHGLPIDDNKVATVEIEDDVRPYFWFIAVADCRPNLLAEHSGVTLKMDYDMYMLNAGGAWTRQFSFDNEGLLALYLVFFVIFAIGCTLQLHSTLALHRASSLHPIVKILTLGVVLETVSVGCYFIHYAIFASDGVGALGLAGLGDFLDMGASLLLLLLLVLLAKGWTISTNTLTDKRVLFTSLGAFAVVYVILFVWERLGMNPATSYYIYETPPGVVFLLLRVAYMGWFLWCLRQSRTDETDENKRKFYGVFGVLYTLWFIALPIVVAIAAAVEPPYRMKTVYALYWITNSLAFGVLGYLLWPTRATDYFKVAPPDILAGSTPYDTI